MHVAAEQVGLGAILKAAGFMGHAGKPQHASLQAWLAACRLPHQRCAVALP